jgi:hypothetical protein
MAQPSPRITTLSWGEVVTEAGAFRDAKLWPGGGRGWDWTETGTDHGVGVQPADVAELLEHGARSIVIGCGQHERLAVSGPAVRAARDGGAAVEVLASHDAAERYNALVDQGAAVGALVHSTC